MFIHFKTVICGPDTGIVQGFDPQGQSLVISNAPLITTKLKLRLKYWGVTSNSFIIPMYFISM